MKRRDNDKKIAVLFVEMRDMMEALLQYAILPCRPYRSNVQTGSAPSRTRRRSDPTG